MVAASEVELAPIGEACDMNLGPRQRRRRLRLGVLGLLLFVGAAVGLIAADTAPAWRLAIWPLAFVASVGFLQFRAKTSVRLALRGRRNLDHGDEAIDDRRVRQVLRRRGARLLALALALSAALVGALLLVPG
jgi:hypothetical protein